MTRRHKLIGFLTFRHLTGGTASHWGRGRGHRKRGRVLRGLGFGRPLTFPDLMGQGSERRRKGRRR